jgi:hypothetical protein
LIPSGTSLLVEGVGAPFDEPAFRALVLIGAVAGLLSRRHRLGLGAFVAMLIALAPVNGSGGWILPMHRMVPTCALRAIGAGIGAWWIGGWLPARGRWRVAAVLPGVAVALLMLVRHRADLSRKYVFNEEYELARSRLAPGGAPRADCRLLTCNQVPGQDVDIHDFRHVLPGMRVFDCLSEDCLSAAAAADGACVYYIRTAGCYWQPDQIVPAGCAATGVSGSGDRLACLGPRAAAVERGLDLRPIELRTIDLIGTFPDRHDGYPREAQIGLFQVQGKHR